MMTQLLLLFLLLLLLFLLFLLNKARNQLIVIIIIIIIIIIISLSFNNPYVVITVLRLRNLYYNIRDKPPTTQQHITQQQHAQTHAHTHTHARARGKSLTGAPRDIFYILHISYNTYCNKSETRIAPAPNAKGPIVLPSLATLALW